MRAARPLGQRALALAAGALVGACRGDRSFRTTAIYEAPRAGCSAGIEARGVVRDGADVSDRSSARVALRATAGSAARPSATLVASLEDGRVRMGVAGVEATPGESLEILAGAWSRAGCAAAPDEMVEMRAAIEGTLLGPKGMLMSGQTRFLKVVSTTTGAQ